ncbi:MAG TPA: septum formation initiator precursor [Rhodobacteraceae bacterium]|nr:septum formation initiator precursor [Paracoccaceae bacterium]
MSGQERKSTLAGAIYIMGLVLAGMYFTFASVQGDYGLFNRVQIDAEARALEVERDRLRAEIALLQNKTQRLSDNYLDLDLLDQQAREVLGLVRGDEIVLR